MVVYQLVYSKLPPGESPWKKTGFHTLLVSPELPRQAVTAIESAIHYPGASILPGDKEVVYWVPVQGQVHLVVLVVRTLGQERDEFGREGMFVAHALIAPPATWQALSHPLDLLAPLRPLVPISVDAIRQIPGADWSTGHLAPLSLGTEAISSYTSETAIPNELLMALLKQAVGVWREGLLVHGAPDAIMNSVAAAWLRLPKDVWPKLSVDPAFDGGKLFFFPIQTVGFSQLEPSTGTPAVFGLADGRFRAHSGLSELTLAASPYERYVQEVALPTDLDACWRMSEALVTGKPAANLAQVPPAFWEANEGWLRSRCAAQAEGSLGPAWADWISRLAPPKTLAEWLLAGSPANGLTALLVDLVPRNARSLPEVPLPKQDQPVLLAALAILKRKDGDAEAIGKLSPTHAHTLLTHLLSETAHHVRLAPLLDRLNPADREALLQSKSGQVLIQRWLADKARWPAVWQPLAAELAAALVAEGDLNLERLTPNRVQDLLARHLALWAPLGLQRVYAWLQTQPAPPTAPTLVALIQVPASSGTLPEAIRQTQAARNAYLDLLVQTHGLTVTQLQAMEWGEGEIAEAMARRPPGLLGKLRRFLGV